MNENVKIKADNNENRNSCNQFIMIEYPIIIEQLI